MTSKYEKAEAIQSYRDAGIDFNGMNTRDRKYTVADQLAEMTFPSHSPCGAVGVLHNGGGLLVDVVVDEAAMREYDSRRMAGVIERTIRQGDDSVRELLRHVAGVDTEASR